MLNFTPVAKKVKPFSWSYSKLKNYRTCPYRYKKIDIDKTYKEDFSGADLAWGNYVHKSFEDRIGKGASFPADLAMYELAALRLLDVPGTITVENKLAITKGLSPCAWYADDAWFRAIADYLAVNDIVALAIDYKTGKIIEDSVQLALLAETIFAHYPRVQAVRTEFWWLKDDAVSREDFYRKDRKKTWLTVMPEVLTLENAHKEMNFPPHKSGLCRNHCIVTDCVHHGGK
jgi:hypothetical protein